MRLSTLRISLFTLALGLVSLWFINQKSTPTSSLSTTDNSAELYQWRTTQSITWEISRNQPDKQNTIQTATWHYNDTTKLSQFTQPIITLTTPKTTTIIRSQTGKTLNNETIQLTGNVRVTQITSPPSTHNTRTLNTQSLTYNASQAELLSRDTITLTQAGSVTTGVGLYADLESGQLQLMSNVKSTYQPDAPIAP